MDSGWCFFAPPLLLSVSLVPQTPVSFSRDCCNLLSSCVCCMCCKTSSVLGLWASSVCHSDNLGGSCRRAHQPPGNLFVRELKGVWAGFLPHVAHFARAECALDAGQAGARPEPRPCSLPHSPSAFPGKASITLSQLQDSVQFWKVSVERQVFQAWSQHTGSSS